MKFEDLTPGLLYSHDSRSPRVEWWFRTCNRGEGGNHADAMERVKPSESWALLEKLDSCYDRAGDVTMCPNRIKVLLLDGRVRILHILRDSWFREVTPC